MEPSPVSDYLSFFGHCNIGQNTSSIKKAFLVYFQSSIDFHILSFDVRKKEDQVARIGVRGGSRRFGQCPKENVFFSVISSLSGNGVFLLLNFTHPLPPSDFSCIISLFSHPLTLTFVPTFQTRIWLGTELKRFWGWVQGGDARHCIAWEEQELWKWWLCGRFGWWWGVQCE